MHLKGAVTGILICGAILYFGACGGRESAADRRSGNAEAKAVFTKYCALCHGEDGKRQANGAKDITLSQMPLQDRMMLIRSGKNLMTPFQGILTPKEIEAVARYTTTLR